MLRFQLRLTSWILNEGKKREKERERERGTEIIEKLVAFKEPFWIKKCCRSIHTICIYDPHYIIIRVYKRTMIQIDSKRASNVVMNNT